MGFKVICYRTLGSLVYKAEFGFSGTNVLFKLMLALHSGLMGITINIPLTRKATLMKMFVALDKLRLFVNKPSILICKLIPLLLCRLLICQNISINFHIVIHFCKYNSPLSPPRDSAKSSSRAL